MTENEEKLYYTAIQESPDRSTTPPTSPPPEIIIANQINLSHVDALNHPTIIMCEMTPPEIRQNFIRKVYTTLWLQLLFTCSGIAMTKSFSDISHFLITPVGISLTYLSTIIMIISLCSFLCCHTTLREHPYDKLFLIIFTFVTTYSLCFISVFYETQILLLGGLSTLGIFSGLSLYAIQTKVDYTTCGNTLCILLFGMIFFGVLLPTHSSIIQISYSVGGAVLFSFYIIYDTQMIMGDPTRKIRFRNDDYALAAVSLYLDLVNMFLYMLDILNGR